MAEPVHGINPRFDEDVHFNLVSPGPPRYRTRTDKPVRYVTVVDKQGGAVLGHVWANDEDDAAAWEPRQAAGGRALAEGGHWHARLEEAKGRGVPPSRALAEMLSRPEGNRGRVLPGSLADAPNADAVTSLAEGGPDPRASAPATPERPTENPHPAGVPQQAGPYGYPAPQGHPGYAAYPGNPQAPSTACMFCAGGPAVHVTFRAHRGILILMTFGKQSGTMCATCGVAVYRELTTRTLWQGWWSPFSLFLFTPFTVVHNLVVARKVKKLQAPAPGRHGPQVDPGLPVHRRPLAYVALVPVLWVLFMIVTGLTQGS
ncbi:hypothetical protein [Streptomyces sp. NBC_00582]|uniref:hypothetical protein n=1 Tax=Streptomyces sp. NBC_00582 TaxID=2975783 RepID=UPI0010E54F95|nr:hypothetical protein [Streptomyces sp. NBC_00582]WUB64735.1 hypothetical protein OG852_32185 [Streptomyces sp. NBC_00582]